MADPKNKWAQPAAPPAPMFFGKKERDLVKQVNDELAERVVGQSIAYYPISIEASNFNDIYGEAIEKVSLPPVRVYAFVEVENEQTHDRYGYEYKSKLTVNFHRKRLTADQNLFVRVGDFVQYGDQFYEIVRTYNDTRYYFGQVEHKFQISAECITARAGTFRVMPSIDRTPPVTSSTSAGPVAEPRSAPYPPVDAEFITVALDDRLTNARYLAAGDGITLTDGGRRSTLSIAATGQNAVGPTGSIQYQLGGGTFSGSTDLTYLPATTRLGIGISAPTHTLTVVGNMSASSDVLIGGDLTVNGTVIGASPLKISGSINVVNSAGTVVATVGSSSLGPDVLSSSLGVVTSLTASGLVSASFFYGDGSNLSGLTTEPAGATTQIQYNATGAFAGSSNLTFNGTTLTGSYTGSLAEVTTLSASLMNLLPTSGTLAGTGSYLGLDASYNLVLTSAAAAPGGASTQVQYNNAGSFAGSSNLTFNGTTLTASYTGSLAELTTLSASAINFILSSGSLAGDGSYLGLDSSNNIVLTASSTSSAAVAGSTTEVQYNSGGSFAASSNLTFNGTTLTGSYTGSLAELTTVSASALSVSGDATLGDASGDTVTITGQTIVLSNVAAGTDNTVLVYNGSSIVTDEIDSRVWGSTLVDASGTPSNNQVGIWTDANTLEGDSSLTFNGTTLTGSYTGSLAELTTLSASATLVTGDSYLSGGLIHKRVTVSSNYTASITDYILGVASVPVSIIFDATSFTDGQVVVIKDESGAASVANPVALSASASQTIDGEGNVAIESPYGAIQLYSNGANWYIY